MSSATSGQPSPRTPAPGGPPKASARLPFDASYPAHLKVLLGSLARSVGSNQASVFTECLLNCLDYLVRYWLGTNLGRLEAIGKANLPVPEEAPSLSEALRLFRYSAFAWESMPEEPMRQLIRLGFFEAQNPPTPRLHTRWLGLAGEPLPEGISADDLANWAQLSDKVMARRVAYLQVLSSFLSSSRPLFLKYHRSYTVNNDHLTLDLSFDGSGPRLPMKPPLPWENYGPRMSLIQVQAVERSTTLPMGPARPAPKAEPAAAPPDTQAPPAPAGPRWDAPRLPSVAPEIVRQIFGPFNALLDKWRPEDDEESDWMQHSIALAPHVVTIWHEMIGVLAALLLGQLRRRGSLPEPLEAALRSFQESEQRLKLLHFAWQALSANPGSEMAFQSVRDVLLEPSGLPRPHSRWLGLPDSLLQGLGRLSFWTRLSRRELPHLTLQEAQHQLAEVCQGLEGLLEAMVPLWQGLSVTWRRREDGCFTGRVVLGSESWDLEAGLPEESPPELEPREPRPLDEVIQDLQVLQQKGTAPYFIVEEVCEFVSSPGGGSGMMVSGPQGAGKSFLLTHLLEEQRQLLMPISPSVTSCDCSWVYCEDSGRYLLESLNEAIAFHRWRGDCDWEPLAPPAVADLYRHQGQDEGGHAPLRAYLHSLWFRNQPRSNTQKIAFLVEHLRDEQAAPWSHTAMPAHFSWVGTSDQELPSGWEAPYPPARLPIPVADASYKRFLNEHLLHSFDVDKDFCAQIAARCQVLSEARLMAGLLHRGLVRRPELLPQGDALFPSLLRRLGLNQEQKRFLVFLAWGGAVPVSLIEACGFDAQEISLLVDLFPWLFLLREEVVGRSQEDWEERLSYLSLGHPHYAHGLLEHIPLEASAIAAGVVERLASRLENEWIRGLNFQTFLSWARKAYREGGEGGERELGWRLLSLESLRKRREWVCAEHERNHRPHRKIAVLSGWIEFLDSLRIEDCPAGLEELLSDTLQEERLWAYSSRALTCRSMGRLREALEDIEHSIGEFRVAVENNSSLLNGLAAAHNRRSEILRELGSYPEALQDAHEAVATYERVLAQSERGHLEPLLALALHNRGVILQELGLLEEAEGDIEKALERYRPWQEQLNARVRLDLARALRTRGRLALLRDDPIRARDDSLRVLRLLERFEESWAELRVERAQAQHQLAEAYLALEEEGRALDASDRAAEIWEGLVQEGRLDLRSVYAQELNHRAQLLLHLGKGDEAAAAVQIACDLHLQLVDSEGRLDLFEHLSRSLLLRGRVWQRGGKWESAKRDYTLACHYLAQQGQDGETRGMRRQTRDALVETGAQLAGLHFQLGESEAAVTQCRGTLALLDGELSSVNLLERKARLLDLLGRSLILQAGVSPLDQEAALEAHDKGLELLSELVDVQGHYHLLPRLAEVHLGRARTRRFLGQEQPALEDANTAVELLAFLSEKGGDPGVLALLGPARLEAAELLWSLGQGERALEHVQDAMSDFELYPEQGVRQTAPLILRGRLFLEAGRNPEALSDFEQALETLRELQQRGWDVEAEVADCLLLKAQAALPSQRSEVVVRDVLEALDEGSSIAQSWESLEKLIHRVEAESRARAGDGRLGEALESYAELLDLLRQAESCASTQELHPYFVRAYRERALVAIQMPSPASETLEEVASGLTRAVQLACFSGGDAYMLAEVFETRARFELYRQRYEAALVDVGRALEAIREVEPDVASQTRLLELYQWRRQLTREHGDVAGEWRDLAHLREILRSSVALDDGANLRLLNEVSERRLELLSSFDLTGPLLDETREALRLLQRQQGYGATPQRARRMVELQLVLAEPRANRTWERDSFELIQPLCEAVDVCSSHDGWAWLPEERLRDALEQAVPICSARLSLALLRAAAQPGGEAWGELYPIALRNCHWEEMPEEAMVHLLEHWADSAQRAQGRWWGEVWKTFLTLSIRPLQSDRVRPAALNCLRSWLAQPSHQLALLGVASDRLASLETQLAEPTATEPLAFEVELEPTPEVDSEVQPFSLELELGLDLALEPSLPEGELPVVLGEIRPADPFDMW